MDALVKNAADPAQVRAAGKREQKNSEQHRDDLRQLLKQDYGRRFIWKILTHCGVFESIWHPSALIHYNSGRQDVGHWLLAQVNDAQLDAILIMMTENAKEKLNAEAK